MEYDTPEMNENPPMQPVIANLTRSILAEKPRVTKFHIDWDDMPGQQNSDENANPNNMMAQA